MTQAQFEHLMAEALAQDFSGWDFSWLRDRWVELAPTWDYRQLVVERIAHADSLLDMGTGGGEFLAALPHRPTHTTATESYPPNIPVARRRLEPLGVQVAGFTDDHALPLPDAAFNLVINRHESYHIPELVRILKPDGLFLTQQVGPSNCIELNEFLHAPVEPDVATWTLAREVEPLEQAGFEVVRSAEQYRDSIFYDIGAVVFYLKIISWQIPDFSVERYRDRLLAMHQHIQENGAFTAHAHRFLIEARKR